MGTSGPRVVEDDWEDLQACVAGLLFPVWDSDGDLAWPCDGERVVLRDTATGQKILFHADDRGVGVTVSVPTERAAADRLRAVLRSQRTTSLSMVRNYEDGRMRALEEPLWRPVPRNTAAAEVDGENSRIVVDEHAREWRTGWRHTADYRDEVAAAIVAVLRDGLNTEPSALRISAFDNYGPDEPPRVRNVVSDRPTSRGVPTCCSDWDEFTARLEWVLLTLPVLGHVSLRITGQSFTIQLGKEDGGTIDGTCWLGAEPVDELTNSRMRQLGWKWAVPPPLVGILDEPSWLPPLSGPGTAHPTMRHLAALTVSTLRVIGGADHPNFLRYQAFANLLGVDDMSYVGAELGVELAIGADASK